MVGMDPLTTTTRFTFGVTELSGGLSFVPAMIGLFAVGELMRGGERGPSSKPAAHCRHFPRRGGGAAPLSDELGTRGEFRPVIGALPGAGGALGAWIAYAFSKRFSREPEKFGTGHSEGLVDARACNNAALCSAWIPARVFGIPGDAVTAIAVGVLFMKS